MENSYGGFVFSNGIDNCSVIRARNGCLKSSETEKAQQRLCAFFVTGDYEAGDNSVPG